MNLHGNVDFAKSRNQTDRYDTAKSTQRTMYLLNLETLKEAASQADSRSRMLDPIGCSSPLSLLLRGKTEVHALCDFDDTLLGRRGVVQWILVGSAYACRGWDLLDLCCAKGSDV